MLIVITNITFRSVSFSPSDTRANRVFVGSSYFRRLLTSTRRPDLAHGWIASVICRRSSFGCLLAVNRGHECASTVHGSRTHLVHQTNACETRQVQRSFIVCTRGASACERSDVVLCERSSTFTRILHVRTCRFVTRARPRQLHIYPLTRGR